MPRFSIIIPVYNVKNFINECVDSVVNQTFTDWELLLIDDGSTDGSQTICDDYSYNDSRVVTVHQSNGGASKARNTGLDKANGEYIIFLDSDDYWEDCNALKLIDEKIESDDADIVVFGCTDFNMNTGERLISRSNYDLDLIDKGDKNNILHYFLSTKLLPGNPNVFCFSKNIVNDSIRFKTGIQDEDYDFVLSVFLNSNSISAINNPFYMYRKGRGDSVTGSSDIKMIYGIEYTVNKWLPICENLDNELLRKDILNYIAFIYSTGFVICGRMDLSVRKESLIIMKKYKSVLKYAYWKKPKLTKYAIRLIGMNLFSVVAAKYFDKTHIF